MRMFLRGLSKAFFAVFTGVGLIAALFGVLLAWPVQQPPELVSISATATAVDRSTMPGLSRFSGRDGTELAYRRYLATAPVTGQVAVVVHGSSGSSVAVHALAAALAARGVETFAPDIRGHGGSGTRGDIRYLGQLDDDLADFVGMIRAKNSTAPLTLIGHSSGGGFALHVAASAYQTLFTRTVLLAPYLGYDAPSSLRDAGGWASPDLPRFVGLSLMRRLGVVCCESLPTIGFAVAPDSSKILVASYSYRLMRNFGTTDYRADLASASRPIALFAGAIDELMAPTKYTDAVGARATVRLFEGVNHMGIVSDKAAISAIADDVAAGGAGS